MEIINLEVLIAPLIGVALIYFLIKLVQLPFWLIKNSVIGWLVLNICNFIGFFTIKITFIHCLIVGVCGVPGIVILLIYLNFFK